ncbi:MAG TPA: hypothetical protein ENH00_03400 [Actinobacteria bacterium]|nr:hypothetical protein [Actinomycetota bacterium]
MPELDEQIRRYVDAVAPPVRSDEIRTVPRRLRRTKAALVGAVVVLVGVGAVFLAPMLRPSPASVFMSGSSDADRGDVIVFVTDDVTTEQRQAIERKLGTLPAVGSFSFIDKDAAYAQFRAMFHDQPAIVEDVDPDMLPASYRVDLTDPRGGEEVVAAIKDLPGVRKVVHAAFDRAPDTNP